MEEYNVECTTPDKWVRILGGYNGNTNRYELGFLCEKSFGLNYGGNMYRDSTRNITSGTYIIKKKGNAFIVEGPVSSSISLPVASSDWSSILNMYLFASSRPNPKSGNPLTDFTGYIYYLKVFESDSLTMDLVPVCKSNTCTEYSPANGMINKVDSNFYPLTNRNR